MHEQNDNHGDPINYLARIRRYYLALGYDTPYRWAHYDEIPFHRPGKPLGTCRVGLVTTAAPYRAGLGDQGPGATYNGAAKFFQVYTNDSEGDPDVRIAHVGYDRKHTSAEDKATWFPLEQLKLAAAAGRIGSVSPRFYGLPTNRSQPTTLEQDCPELLNQLLKDDVDVAILVANCPVCHQSCSLGARHLERAGIASVVMGCARDIVEHVGVPRLSFCDFPLGNAAGKPGDPASQHAALEQALKLIESAESPATTWRLPIEWTDNDHWKEDFYNIDRLSAGELATLRQNFDQQKSAARGQQQKAAELKSQRQRPC